MFGNNKPFGTASAFGTSGFGTTTTPFGQTNTAFGAKPAASNVFGTSAFGVAQPNTGGLFGSSAPSTGTGLFGQPSTAFGTPSSTSTGTFGFGATSTTGGLFGNTAASTQSSGGLFGGGTSAFGAPRPTFGGFGTTTPSTGLFGQSTNTGTGLFGSSGGFATTAQMGTTIKFSPPTGSDTMMKGGVSTSIGTRHQCITCMKEYENKSLEELRVEDYAAGRKGTAGAGMGFGNTAQTGLFGTPAASTSGFSFGSTTQSKPLFGTTGGTNTFGTGGSLFGQPTQNQTTGLFGKSVGFGAPTTSAAPVFNFGGTSGTSLFGQNNQPKPLFGQTSTVGTGLFGNTTTTQGTGFGTSTGFGAFGSTNQPSTGLFGTKPTGFGATNTTTTNTFSFGNANMTGGGLFGQKPAAPAFGASTGFGTQTSGFGSFGVNQTGTGLFGQPKPTTSVFGGTGNTFGTGLGNTFGSSFSTGLGTSTGTGLFGSSNANKGPGFNFGNTGNTGFSFGGANTAGPGFGFNASSVVPGSDPNTAAVLQQAQQQILAMAVNPFGDSPLFRNPIKDTPREVEVLKPTNPSAQKALLSDNQYKVALLPTAKIKPKPWSPNPSGKVFLFDGLEDEESSLGNAAFLPKKSVKKLVLKNVGNSQSTLTLTSNISSASQPTRIDVSISLKNSDKSVSCGDALPSVVPLTVDVAERALSRTHKDASNVSQSSVKSNESVSQGSLHAVESHMSVGNSMNDSIADLHTNKQKPPNKTYGVWSESEEDCRDSSVGEASDINNSINNEPARNPVHESGITLTRPGYFTIPSLDDIRSRIDDDGNCFIENFTVGRDGYGKVMFPGMTNVVGLNLDEIVHFNKKEINVYPEDEKKPPIGEGLNRKAVVTLENVWPVDKTNHSPIKDPERLNKLGYREKIERSTSRLGATFINYKPDTGSWIFQVDHFSKYGLVDDSDEEMEVPNQTETKAKSVMPTAQLETANGQLELGNVLQKQQLKRKPIASFATEDEEMEGASSQIQLPGDSEYSNDAHFLSDVYSPTRPILNSVVDAERIQGMKASFFQEEVDEENWGPGLYEGQNSFIKDKDAKKETHVQLKPKNFDLFTSDVSKRLKHLDYDVNNSFMTVNSSLKYSEIGIQNSLSSLSISVPKKDDWLSMFPIIKSASQPSVQQQKTMPVILNKICLKPLRKSVLYRKEHLIADAGYFMGRSFRVGWRADGTYMQLDAPEETDKLLESVPMFLLYGEQIASGSKSLQKSGFTLLLKKLAVVDTDKSGIKSIQKNLADALNLQLENSATTVEKGAPLFVPKPGVELIHAHAQLFENHLKDADPLDSDVSFIQQCVYVWKLLVSLWGKVRDMQESQAPSNYSCQMARREALSQWLIKATEGYISKGITSTNQRDNYLYKIFLYLSGRRISDAVKLAQQFQDFRLSLLLSQAEGNIVVRKLISRQLLNWEQNGAYNYIKYNRIILYALLAGMLIWENVYETVNCCKNLDWKQVLALHLWYHCDPNASIQDAVENYDNSFQGTASQKKYALPPYPHYVDISEVIKEMDESEEHDDMVYDTCYHLLKLYCDRTHRFDQLLMPATYSLNHLDYRLSWFLHLALTSVGYNIPSELASTLHMNFALQLESIGMWHWAVFVLLHHPSAEMRTKYVKDILLRHVSLELTDDCEEKENFVKRQLLIPEKWIFEAKSIRAHSEGRHAEEAWFLLKAEFWSKSHSVVIKYLASDAVINEDYDYLTKYLSELAMPERSCTILDWANGGQVYLDYINMCQVVQGVISRETSAYDLEKFTPEVVSLCNRLSSIPTVSLKDRLSVAEMAKKTATILRSIAILQASRERNSTSLSRLATYFKNLPMPHDYAVSENRFIAHYLLDC